MDKGSLPNRVVYLSYAPEDQALADELKERLAAKDYPQADFRFPKPVFAHVPSLSATMKCPNSCTSIASAKSSTHATMYRTVAAVSIIRKPRSQTTRRRS